VVLIVIAGVGSYFHVLPDNSIEIVLALIGGHAANGVSLMTKKNVTNTTPSNFDLTDSRG